MSHRPSLASLPLDTLQSIITTLAVRDILRLAATCRSTRSILGVSKTWERLDFTGLWAKLDNATFVKFVKRVSENRTALPANVKKLWIL
ncbi:hypothetical protein M427DRAFT_55784 [Gonapodya prolifera JEL478]|uniref:F-box domain-containing protein n=1 Tax=Gonapodya prolifera (strain JEL478) TaxID=1344416 RepID=A0A139AII7_GONPJ|nr:hypothetical protein M427DRAFT_55784 [Gonapodya prolifera JEL478]|eukprot:KXS16364.1 hypothetical protein M427DRAFT_55784 [Gonapodya prolifera JEL478]